MLIYKARFFIFITTIMLFTSFALANQQSNKQLMAKLNSLAITNPIIEEQKINNQQFFTVLADQGVFYVSEDLKTLFPGPLFEIKNNVALNLTTKFSATKLKELTTTAVLYQAKNEKYRVYVFFDITCEYCRMLHNEIEKYNNTGISIYFLAYPRQGLASNTAKQMEAIFTDKSPKLALDDAMRGKVFNGKTPTIISKHFMLGNALQIKGTPAIISENGAVFGGYIPVDKLIPLLNNYK